jgi:hypothetical protein
MSGGLTAASTTRRADNRTSAVGQGVSGSRGRALSREEAIGYPLLVFAVHWLIVQLAATIAYRIGVPNAHSAPYGQLPPPLDGLANLIVEPLRHWDGLWYALIATEGYGGTTETARAAFWPLFPWLMDLGNQLTGWPVEVIGYLLSNVAFAVALILLYRLVNIDFDREVARRTLWAVALFPTALFFTAVYTESLFLVLVVGALLAARQGHWLAASAPSPPSPAPTASCSGCRSWCCSTSNTGSICAAGSRRPSSPPCRCSAPPSSAGTSIRSRATGGPSSMSRSNGTATARCRGRRCAAALRPATG